MRPKRQAILVCLAPEVAHNDPSRVSIPKRDRAFGEAKVESSSGSNLVQKLR